MVGRPPLLLPGAIGPDQLVGGGTSPHLCGPRDACETTATSWRAGLARQSPESREQPLLTALAAHVLHAGPAGGSGRGEGCIQARRTSSCGSAWRPDLQSREPLQMCRPCLLRLSGRTGKGCESPVLPPALKGRSWRGRALARTPMLLCKNPSPRRCARRGPPAALAREHAASDVRHHLGNLANGGGSICSS
jgi:hypothetical protein